MKYQNAGMYYLSEISLHRTSITCSAHPLHIHHNMSSLPLPETCRERFPVVQPTFPGLLCSFH